MAEKKTSMVEKSGRLFILSGQSNITAGLEKGFTDVVTKALGNDQVTVVRSMKRGRISDFNLCGESNECWHLMREVQVDIAESDKLGA